MIKFTKKEKIIISMFVVFAILFIGSKCYIHKMNKPVFEIKGEDAKEIEENIGDDVKENAKEAEDTLESRRVLVDICGEVKNPGVVALSEGDRVIDAVNLAGGLLESADRKQINMARIVKDGEQIYIPKKGENMQQMLSINKQNIVINPSIKININKASQTELESLAGIGPALAKRIIQYREEKGDFQRIEDIMKVSGIGEKKYEGIKNNICVY